MCELIEYVAYTDQVRNIMTFVQVTVPGNTINKALTELQGWLFLFHFYNLNCYSEIHSMLINSAAMS